MLALAGLVVLTVAGCGSSSEADTPTTATISATEADTIDQLRAVAVDMCLKSGDVTTPADDTMDAIDNYVEAEGEAIRLLREDPDAVVGDGKTVRDIAVDTLGSMSDECESNLGKSLREVVDQLPPPE